jgi:hypothetical protein
MMKAFLSCVFCAILGALSGSLVAYGSGAVPKTCPSIPHYNYDNSCSEIVDPYVTCQSQICAYIRCYQDCAEQSYPNQNNITYKCVSSQNWCDLQFFWCHSASVDCSFASAHHQ